MESSKKNYTEVTRKDEVFWPVTLVLFFTVVNYTLGLGRNFELQIILFALVGAFFFSRKFVFYKKNISTFVIIFYLGVFWYFLVLSLNYDANNHAIIFFLKIARLLLISFVILQISGIHQISFQIFKYTTALAAISVVIWMVLYIINDRFFLGIDFIQTDGRLQLFGNPNYIAFWVAMVALLGFSLYEKKIISRKYFVFSFTILFIFILATLSRSVIISLVAAILVSNFIGSIKFKSNTILISKNLVIALMSFLLIFLFLLIVTRYFDFAFAMRLFNFDEFDNACVNDCGRNTIWTFLLESFYDAPLLLQLFGLSLHGLIILDNPFPIYPHNNYILLLLNFGFLGLVGFVVWLIYSLFSALKRRSRHMTRFFIFIIILSGAMDFVHGLSFAIMFSIFLNPNWSFPNENEK